MDISKSLSKDDETLSLDIISTLPQSVLEIILCLLPTKEAARTSILSRDWRYQWTKIPKLEFWLSNVPKRLTEESMDETCDPCYYLLQILLTHRGLIQEFTLDIDLNYDPIELDRLILHLSKNHKIKKLTLLGLDKNNWDDKLPISVFSMHHLTDLDLFYFDIDHGKKFNGFVKLRSLSLVGIEISSESLLHLLSNCPSLKSLTLEIGEYYLKDADCTIIQLFKCLPMIEHLTVFGLVLEWLVIDSVLQDLPTLLFHLKYFCFERGWYTPSPRLEPFLLALIKCSPNLEKIKLQIPYDECDDECTCTFVWEDYSDVRLEHLNELEVDFFSRNRSEMELVKFISTRSPKLKNVSILGTRNRDKQCEVLRILSQAMGNSNCQIRFAAKSNLARDLR